MIEVIIKENKKDEEISYPCIKKSENGNIVLFTRPKKGTILNSESGFYPIGYYGKDWAEEVFKDFLGEICLSIQQRR
jgi:hypothetical protein